MEDFDEKPIDLTKSETHSTEVLLEVISKLETTSKELERTKKQLDIALDCIKEFADSDNWEISVCDDFIYKPKTKVKYPWRIGIGVYKKIAELEK